MRIVVAGSTEQDISPALERRIREGVAVRKAFEMSVAVSLEVQRWSRRRAEPDLGRSEPLHEHHGTSAFRAGPQGRRVIRLRAVFHAGFAGRSEQAEANR